MRLLVLAGLLSTAIAFPIPFAHSGGSSSEQRFNFYPPQGLPFFPPIPFPLPPQIPFPPLPPPPPIPFPFPIPFDPNQVLTINDFISLLISILNQLGGFLG